MPTSVTPELTLGNAGFSPEQLAVYVNFINPIHAMLLTVSGEYTLTDSNKKEWFKDNFSEFSMAPQTQIDFSLRWVSSKLDPGTYTLYITGTADGKSFSYRKTFTISADQVKSALESNTLPVATEIPVWGWIMGALGVVIITALVIFVIILLRKKKMKKFQMTIPQINNKPDDNKD